ncbi:hypothetical protein KIL84_015501 [Mauremys mutica]|uniref:Uncharacterized protein n=1 Tax=Mauremys mutica TaxID=74926 RepID=A0A9D3WME7_9SAUR|nr:hypothetical protein KIL84_015501 [Mauremys mutica]
MLSYVSARKKELSLFAGYNDPCVTRRFYYKPSIFHSFDPFNAYLMSLSSQGRRSFLLLVSCEYSTRKGTKLYLNTALSSFFTPHTAEIWHTCELTHSQC